MNKSEILGNAAIIGGMLMSGGAIKDAIQNRPEILRQEAVTQQLREKFGIKAKCGGGVFSEGQGLACYDAVPDAVSQEEEDAVLSQFKQELQKAHTPTPTRGTVDGFLAAIGIDSVLMGAVSKIKTK